MSGAFFAFSSFVMAEFRRLPASQGIAAMQSINVTAVTPVFMFALFGTALGCAAVAVSAIVTWTSPASTYMLVGAVVYLVGVIVLTAAYHVPRNNTLADMDPATEDAGSYWSRYAAGWTNWNHVRTLSALTAAAFLTIAARVG